MSHGGSLRWMPFSLADSDARAVAGRLEKWLRSSNAPAVQGMPIPMRWPSG